EMPKEKVDISNDRLEHVNLSNEEIQQVRLHGILGTHVQDEKLAVLTVSMIPPDPLLDPERIPRKIVVHDGPSELEVPALAPRLRTQKDLAVLAERPHGRVLRREGETAVVCRDAVPFRLEDFPEILQRPQILREVERLLA